MGRFVAVQLTALQYRIQLKIPTRASCARNQLALQCVDMSNLMVVITVPLLLFFGVLIFIDIGYRIGRRQRARGDESPQEDIGPVDAAVFGLLGLTLAFTFSGASDRLAVRRAQIVQEANAIGTAYLRLDLLPVSDQPPIRTLFREYLEARIEVYDKFLDRTASNAALEKSNGLQREIWSRSIPASRRMPDTAASLLLIPALNEMFDISTTRTMAAFTHAPAVILVLLVVLSFVAAVLSGTAMSSQSRRNVLQMVLFAVAISFTVYVVLDLEYPRAGIINLTAMDEAILQLRETMK
jgi:hypothetical protein